MSCEEHNKSELQVTDEITAEDTGKSRKGFKVNFSLVILIVSAFLIGTYLRLYMISDQILLDDEWHGMGFAVDNSFGYIFLHFTRVGANSIPMNLYRLILLRTVGWSELLLRLPALVPGILSLVVFPVLVRKMVSNRATIIFVFLLAVSPLVIFYSRFSRPYSMYMFLSFISVLALYFWAVGEGRKFVVIYVITAVCAVYFHLFAFFIMIGPLVFIFLAKFVQNLFSVSKEKIRIAPALVHIFLAGMVVVLMLSVLLLPALLQSLTTLRRNVDRMTVESFAGLAQMLSGTSNPVLVFLWLILLIIGLTAALRKSVVLGGIILTVFAISFLAMFFLSSIYIHSPIVISRYAITIYPLSFMLIALGMDDFLRGVCLLVKGIYCKGLCNLIAAAFVIFLFLAGPLGRTYTSPNNFAHHFAFQQSVGQINWDRSFIPNIRPEILRVDREGIPLFYWHLAREPGTKTIIEHPMLVGDHFNLYYYYQHFHRKKVMAGYITKIKMGVMGSGGYVFGSVCLGQVLSRAPDKSKLKFRNLIDAGDINAVKQSGAEYIILHKNLMKEWSAPAELIRPDIFATTAYLDVLYRDNLGQPFYEDKDLIVYRITPGPL
jgi:hypothetical protein